MIHNDVSRAPMLDPRAPGFYVQVYASVDYRTIHHLVYRLRRELAALPRWRWLRRFHVERQLFVAELAWSCYRAGVLQFHHGGDDGGLG